MTIIYLESSALMKRYVPEAGSDVLDELFEQKDPGWFFAMSAFATVELKSALRRLVKGEKLGQSEYQNVLFIIARDVPAMSLLLPVDNALMEEAAVTLEVHALRTGDAIHLASVLRLKREAEASNEFLLVVGSDMEFLESCRRESVAVLNPEASDALQALNSAR